MYAKPFPDSQISSGYGRRALAGGTFHEGIDYRLAMNTPLPALADGVVVGRGESKKFGKWIAVRADEGGYYRWHACNDILVADGARVRRGQTIALSGMTGFWSTGPHGHLQCTRTINPNSFINPLSVIGISAPAPVPVAVDLGARAHFTHPEEFDMSDIKYFHRVEKGYTAEWMIAGMELPGGFMTTTHEGVAASWGHLYGTDRGDSWFALSRKQYIQVQASAATLNAAYVKQQKAIHA